MAQTATGPTALAANTFKHVAVTIKGGDALTPGQMLLYEDGVLVGLQHRADAQARRTWPRRRASSAVRRTRAGSSSGERIKDFRIYSKELTASQVKALSDETAPGNLAELKASVDLGDTSAVTRNLTLPAVPGVAWSSSDPAVVTALGVVTRPAAGQGDGHATLTATFNHRGLTDTKEFPVTVKQRVVYHAASSSPPGSRTTTSSTRPPEPRWPTRAVRAPRATRRW